MKGAVYPSRCSEDPRGGGGPGGAGKVLTDGVERRILQGQAGGALLCRASVRLSHVCLSFHFVVKRLFEMMIWETEFL